MTPYFVLFMHGEANWSLHSLPRRPSDCKISSAQKQNWGWRRSAFTTSLLSPIGADNKSSLSATPSPPVSPSPLQLWTAASSAVAVDRHRESGRRQAAGGCSRAADHSCSGHSRERLRAGGLSRAGPVRRPAAGSGLRMAAGRFARGACMPAAVSCCWPAAGGSSSGRGPLLQRPQDAAASRRRPGPLARRESGWRGSLLATKSLHEPVVPLLL